MKPALLLMLNSSVLDRARPIHLLYRSLERVPLSLGRHRRSSSTSRGSPPTQESRRRPSQSLLHAAAAVGLSTARHHQTHALQRERLSGRRSAT